MLGDPRLMVVGPGETANDHILRNDVQVFPGTDGHMDYRPDTLPLVIDGANEERELDTRECFQYANSLENNILRNLNGFGKVTGVSDKAMEETTEQYLWASSKHPNINDIDDECLEMPMPKKGCKHH